MVEFGSLPMLCSRPETAIDSCSEKVPDRQRDITRLCARTALVLMQHGAESALVEGMARRLGLALGADSVEIALMANAIVITTLSEVHCITTVRRSWDQGINMHLVIEVQRMVLEVEAGRLDCEGYRDRLDLLRPLKYPRWIVALSIGVSCACFARLASAEAASCLVTFAATTLAMFVRLHLASRHFSPLVTFFATAFCATSIAAHGLIARIGDTPKTAIAASVLMLVPGFPLINAVADMVKGYMNTGIARWALAMMLSIATCAGILLATSVWNVWGWL